MTDTPLEAAVTRLERAIARVERAATAEPADDAGALALLEQRHDRLRTRVQEVIERLDGLIAPAGADA